MLELYPLAKDRLLAVKAGLGYHKLVLLVESPLLHVTGRLSELIRNLNVFLGADQAAVTVPAAPSRKRRKMSPTPEDSSDEADQEEAHDGPSDEDQHDEESLDQEAEMPEPFEFTRLGETVAVHCDFQEDFFIGEVEKIISLMEGRGSELFGATGHKEESISLAYLSRQVSGPQKCGCREPNCFSCIFIREKHHPGQHAGCHSKAQYVQTAVLHVIWRVETLAY